MHPNELFSLKERKLEIQRQKRILVGREEGRIIDGLNLDEDNLLNDNVAYVETHLMDEDNDDDEDQLKIISISDENISLIPIVTNNCDNNAKLKVINIQTTQNVVEQSQTTVIGDGTILSQECTVNYHNLTSSSTVCDDKDNL